MMSAADPIESFIPRRQSRKIVIILAILASASACGGWPPDSDQLKNRFLQNRESFVALENKMLSSDYDRVVQYRTTDANLVLFEWSENDEQGNDIRQRSIEEAPDWWDILAASKVFTASQGDGIVSFEPTPVLSKRLKWLIGLRPNDNRSMHIHYVHHAGLRTSIRPCETGFESLGCGACIVDIGDDWFIQYWWFPRDFVQGGFDRVLDGELSEEEYDALSEQRMEQCFAEGAEATEYRSSENIIPD